MGEGTVILRTKLQPITSIAVNRPPAMAKPIEYKVSEVVHVSLLTSSMMNTISAPKSEDIMPPFSMVERWLARWIEKIATHEVTAAYNPK